MKSTSSALLGAVSSIRADITNIGHGHRSNTKEERERERETNSERERELYMYIYIYMCMRICPKIIANIVSEAKIGVSNNMAT